MKRKLRQIMAQAALAILRKVDYYVAGSNPGYTFEEEVEDPYRTCKVPRKGQYSANLQPAWLSAAGLSLLLADKGRARSHIARVDGAAGKIDQARVERARLQLDS